MFKLQRIKKKEHSCEYSFCDSDRIQTCNLLIRSQVLYSVELRNHCYGCKQITSNLSFLNCECKGIAFYWFHQMFRNLFYYFFYSSSCNVGREM